MRARVRQLGGDPWVLLMLGLLGVGVLMRVNNALRYPSLHGYDGYAHVTYVWHLIRSGDLPLPNEGWGRFHPPLYYAICAAIWSGLRDLPPSTVLKVLSVLFSLAGLVSALVAWALARRLLPERPLVQLLAPAFVLFLPVHVYTAPMLGNEAFTTVLCSLALYLLVRVLESGRWAHAAALGVAVGAALLTKFTAVAYVAVTIVVLGLAGLRTGRLRVAAAHACVAGAIMLAVAGWFYARNIQLYGTPFQMSREYFVTRRIESAQAHGRRDLLSYLTINPQIFREPLYKSGSVADSVWTGAYASTWFDAYGNWFLPYNATTKALGRALLVLGIVPTLLIAVGLARAIAWVARRGWHDVLVVSLAATGVMVGMFCAYTWVNRIVSAAKASYLLPAVVPFGLWFALGVETVTGWGRRWRALVIGELALLLAVIVPIYTYQLLFEVGLGPHYWNTVAAVEYFAGFPERARRTLTAIVRHHDLYLARENLAAIALDEDRPWAALRQLRRANRLLPLQALGGLPSDRAILVRDTRADYQNSFAVIYYRLAMPDAALRAARRAIELDPGLPEAHYNLAVLHLERDAPAEAIAALEHAVALDPGFAAAHALLGVAQQRTGDCAAAMRTLARVEATRRWPRRAYAHAVGTGDLHDAAVVRHRWIDVLPPELAPARARATCRAGGERPT